MLDQKTQDHDNKSKIQFESKVFNPVRERAVG